MSCNTGVAHGSLGYYLSCKIDSLVRGRIAFDGRKLVSLKRLKYGCDLYNIIEYIVN